MKRDMALIYEMLREVESRPTDFRDDGTGISIDGRDKDELDYHAKLLFAAGLLKGTIFESIGGNFKYWVSHLTNAGHNFLDDWRKGERSMRLEDVYQVSEAMETLKEIERHLGRMDRHSSRR